MSEIRTFQMEDMAQVIALVLHCQNDGSRPLVSVMDQPELLCIQEKYMDGGGNFWVAVAQERIVGSIGLMNGGDGIGILKKFFVYEPFRGKPCHLGRQLYEVFLEFVMTHGFKQIILDTPKNTERAHKFYEKAGFEKIGAEELPISYDFPYKDSDFFRLMLPVACVGA